jgi:translation elongation factor P/translation initiation factor 5A
MIDVNELRKGVTFEFDGGLYKVLDYSHNKTGRGNANIRIKARNLQTGANIERTFSSGQSVQDVSLDFHNVSYLYTDGDFYHFMDNETFEQPAIKGDVLGEKAPFLKEGMEVKLTFLIMHRSISKSRFADLSCGSRDAIRRHTGVTKRSSPRRDSKRSVLVCEGGRYHPCQYETGGYAIRV